MSIFQRIISCIRNFFGLSNVSLDTSDWPKGFHSSSECKNITFSLTEEQLSTDTSPIMEFLQKNSSQSLHVEIECTYSVFRDLVARWCSQFIAFLQILSTNSQLISVKFLGLSYCFKKTDSVAYVDICRTIIHFLESQHRLKRVEFHYCCFRFNEGVEIMRKLVQNNRESVSHLTLLGFLRFEPISKVLSFRDSFLINPSAAAQNLPLLVDFPSLTTLEIDYPFILENMVLRQFTPIQTVKNRPLLSKIILHYNNRRISIDAFRGVTSTDWRFLKTLCPDLQVEWSISTNLASLRELEFLIVPNMPITRLTYLCDNFDMEMENDVLFGHLLACNTNNHLVSLSVGWGAMPVPDLATTLPTFLQACKKLKYLSLYVSHPIIGVDILMQSWLENRPESLEKVIISIFEMETEAEYSNLVTLARALKWKGLNVKVDLYF